MHRSRNTSPDPRSGHLPLTRIAPVPLGAPDTDSRRPPAGVLAGAVAGALLLMLLLVVGGGSPDRNVAPPDVAPPTYLPPGAYLMPLFATVEGAVAHESQPLWAAWIETGEEGPLLYVGAASGISPVDVAVFRVAPVGADERIMAWGEDGISLLGDIGTRLIPLPSGLHVYEGAG